MNRIKSYRELKLGYPVVLSLTCHILVFVILTNLHVFSALKISEAPVYYVDLLNLPVAEPRAGSPAPATSVAPPAAPAAPAPPAPPSPSAMKLPAKAPEKAQPAKVPQPTKAETAQEFEKRMQQMERDSEARHAAKALEAMQKRAAAGRTGVPAGKGTQAGSDYSSFIRSRLEDAFRKEDTFKRGDRGKMVAVRLVIGVNGRVNTIWVDRESSDKMFNDSVLRAIHRAENDFVPPPGGMQVELGFVFKPQEGVGKK